MYDNLEVCGRITDFLPEIGVCGVDVKVTHDDDLKAWRVNYVEEGCPAVAYLDEADVDRCLDGRECLSLGLMVRQQIASRRGVVSAVDL